MAKIDTDLDGIQAGFQNPDLRIGTTFIPDDKMSSLGLRRRKAGQDQHKVWYISIGEVGAAPTATFWGHKFSECLTAAMVWRGTYVKSSRGRKSSAAA